MNITRKGTFDACHRIMNERIKCFNLHGHTYHYELTFAFKMDATELSKSNQLGYPVDFKEIKRVFCQWIDDNWDHAAILNPKDDVVIDCVNQLHSKSWIMSLNGEDYCNPSVECMARELFHIIAYMCDIVSDDEYYLQSITLYETPNCCCTVNINDVIDDDTEFNNVMNKYQNMIYKYVKDKGTFIYDDRLINN